MLALGTSLDGFAIGMPVGSLGVSISPLVPVTGVVVASFALLGSLLAARVGRSWGRRAEFAGGVALCFMGAKILIVR